MKRCGTGFHPIAGSDEKTGFLFSEINDMIGVRKNRCVWGSAEDAWNRFREIQHIRLPELIMCDEAEFDEKWDAFTEEIKPFAEEYGNYIWNDVTEQVFSYFANI